MFLEKNNSNSLESVGNQCSGLIWRKQFRSSFSDSDHNSDNFIHYYPFTHTKIFFYKKVNKIPKYVVRFFQSYFVLKILEIWEFDSFLIFEIISWPHVTSSCCTARTIYSRILFIYLVKTIFECKFIILFETTQWNIPRWDFYDCWYWYIPARTHLSYLLLYCLFLLFLKKFWTISDKRNFNYITLCTTMRSKRICW